MIYIEKEEEENRVWFGIVEGFLGVFNMVLINIIEKLIIHLF